MKLSTRGRYGVRGMVELAMHYGKKPISLRELASGQEISAKYLEQLLIPLKGAGLVKSIRGAHGGYLLALPPEEITLYDIVSVLEGPMAVVECVRDDEFCDRLGDCTVRGIWDEMSGIIRDYLSSVTLSELVERQKSQSRQCATA